MLGHYCRELELFPLEQAVRKMTGLSAQTFALEDRGVLRAGAFADIVLFDPMGVRDRATFAEPTAPAAGIDQVLVNGELAWRDGAGTGARTGKVLKNKVAVGRTCWAPCEITSG